MALDIYVGSFTRYHAGTWENVVARCCREQGMQYYTSHHKTTGSPAEQEDAVTDPAILRPAVEAWRAALNASLATVLPAGLSWEESEDTKWFSDRPYWEGYASLIRIAAQHEHPDMPFPQEVTTDWTTDAAYQASMSEGFKSRFSHLFRAEIWLPCPFEFTFTGPDLPGRETSFGSSVRLLEQLRSLNAETYGGSADDVAEWMRQGGGPPGSFEQAAKLGLGQFLHHAELSVEHCLPMKLDY